MSSYIVEDVTINRIVTYLGDGPAASILAQIEPDGEYSQIPLLAALGQRMFQLNIRAVEARYGEGEALTFRPLDYEYRPAPASLWQVYKSLCCWLYQCNEDDVPDDPLYCHFADNVAPRLAADIIVQQPEYKAAKWG